MLGFFIDKLSNNEKEMEVKSMKNYALIKTVLYEVVRIKPVMTSSEEGGGGAFYRACVRQNLNEGKSSDLHAV